MTWIKTLVVALATAVAGLFVAGLIADLCVDWYGISSFEGGSGYYVVFIALAGGIAGFLLGAITSRAVARPAGGDFGRMLGWSLGLTGGIALVALGLAWLGGDQGPTLDGEELALMVELRMPEGWSPPPDFARQAGGTWLTSLGLNNERRRTEYGRVLWDEVRERDGRWVIPSRTYLFTTRGKRLLRVMWADSSEVEILVPLPKRPGREFLRWSDWSGEGFLQEVGKPPVTGFAYRFKVEPLGAQQAREAAADSARRATERAAFDALGPSSPLAAWLPYARSTAYADDMRDSAVAALGARIGEYPALFALEDPEQLGLALQVAQVLPKLPASARGQLLAAGQRLVADVREWTPEAGEARALQLDDAARHWMTLWSQQYCIDAEGMRPILEGFIAAAREQGEGSPFASLAEDARSRLPGASDST